MKQRTKWMVTIVALFSISMSFQPVLASGMIAGATEPTQLLNHVELIQQVANQATQIQNQINAYSTMIQQLRALPPGLVGQVTMPWQDALSGYQALSQAVGGVQTSYAATYETLSFRRGQMDALHMNPSQYLNAELQLADARGGYYKNAINKDIQVLDTATKRAETLRQVTNSIPSIAGSVQGLQTLATQSSMVAGELQDIKVAIVQQKLASQNEAYKKAQEDQLRADRDLQIMKEQNERSARLPQKSQFQFTPKW